jgi:hypothetical protein
MNSVVEPLPGIPEALGLIPSTATNKNKNQNKNMKEAKDQ